MTNLKENINEIFSLIDAAAKGVGKEGKDITLVAATKMVEAERINEGIRCGIRHIGENKVQEFTEKFGSIEGDVTHHFIGHLQTNKVKYLIPHVKLIHSADSEKLLDEIDRISAKHGVITEALIEINASGEESKFGIEFEDAEKIIRNNENRHNCRIMGLMTIGPNVPTEESIREAFRKMKNLFDRLSEMSFEKSEMKYLSMGMSGDYEIAISEGANMVRIGSAIFGKRNYQI